LFPKHRYPQIEFHKTGKFMPISHGCTAEAFIGAVISASSKNRRWN